MNIEELRIYTNEMVKRSGISDPAFTESFLKALGEHPEIADEYAFYLERGAYRCAHTVCGYSIADIVIWQMDNFKALLDNSEAQNKGNPYRMTLLGFDTMMKLSDDPDHYISKMQSTTGTDYIGKF